MIFLIKAPTFEIVTIFVNIIMHESHVLKRVFAKRLVTVFLLPTVNDVLERYMYMILQKTTLTIHV